MVIIITPRNQSTLNCSTTNHRRIHQITSKKMWLFPFWLHWLMADETNATEIRPTRFPAYDCNPDSVSAQYTQLLAGPTPCTPPQGSYQEPRQIHIQLLTQSQRVPVKGRNCLLTLTEYVTHCGPGQSLYGLSIHRPTLVDPEACWKTIRTGSLWFQDRELKMPPNVKVLRREWDVANDSRAVQLCNREHPPSDTWRSDPPLLGRTVPTPRLLTIATLRVPEVHGELRLDSGQIIWDNGVVVDQADGAALHNDGTIVWEVDDQNCQFPLAEAYRGPATLHKLSRNRGQHIEPGDLTLIASTRGPLAAFQAVGRFSRCDRQLVQTQVASAALLELTSEGEPFEVPTRRTNQTHTGSTLFDKSLLYAYIRLRRKEEGKIAKKTP